MVLIGREFLITQGSADTPSRGELIFGRTGRGKLKMIVQCVAGGAVLFHIATGWKYQWVQITRDVAIWLTLLVTVLSATGYITRRAAAVDSRVNAGE